VVATAPAGQLVKASTLTVCTDTTNPPQSFRHLATDAPVGSDIDLAGAIAARMGLNVEIRQTSGDVLMAALNTSQCDIVISGQPINEVSEQQADMIPYFQAGQAFVVMTGNPQRISAVLDLCGRAVAVKRGTTEADHLNPTGRGAYKVAEGLTAQCLAAHRPAIVSRTVDADGEALEALRAGSAVAYFTAEPVAGYDVLLGGGAFEMLPYLVLDRQTEGIAVARTHPGLQDAVKICLRSLIHDGTYDQIVARWGVSSDELAAPPD
jgi:polar amino acid transport system substrate-binding protein